MPALIMLFQIRTGVHFPERYHIQVSLSEKSSFSAGHNTGFRITCCDQREKCLVGMYNETLQLPQ